MLPKIKLAPIPSPMMQPITIRTNAKIIIEELCLSFGFFFSCDRRYTPGMKNIIPIKINSIVDRPAPNPAPSPKLKAFPNALPPLPDFFCTIF